MEVTICDLQSARENGTPSATVCVYGTGGSNAVECPAQQASRGSEYRNHASVRAITPNAGRARRTGEEGRRIGKEVRFAIQRRVRCDTTTNDASEIAAKTANWLSCRTIRDNTSSNGKTMTSRARFLFRVSLVPIVCTWPTVLWLAAIAGNVARGSPQPFSAITQEYVKVQGAVFAMALVVGVVVLSLRWRDKTADRER